MKFTRKEILNAIRTENLGQKGFIDDDFPFAKNCKVCAVGALLRKKKVHDVKIERTAASLIELEQQASSGNGFTHSVASCGDEHMCLYNEFYLSALSIKFEKLASSYGCGKVTRSKLAKFVKDNFPKEFKV